MGTVDGDTVDMMVWSIRCEHCAYDMGIMNKICIALTNATLQKAIKASNEHDNTIQTHTQSLLSVSSFLKLKSLALRLAILMACTMLSKVLNSESSEQLGMTTTLV